MRLSLLKTGSLIKPGSLINDARGAALLIVLLTAALLAAIAAALVAISTTETLISASHRHAQEASYGADAALERSLHDLATLPDWTVVLAVPPGNVQSTFLDGALSPRLPDGRRLDLQRLTIERQRTSDTRDGPDRFGADSPQWRLFAHSSLSELLSPGEIHLPLYSVVWIADDGADGDGNPSADSNSRVILHAAGFGARGARRAVEAEVVRSDAGEVRVVAWREVR
jgi:hypothetical protein